MLAKLHTFDDRASTFRRSQQRFQSSRMAEKDYARKLRHIAKQVGVIVNGFAPNGNVEHMDKLQDHLSKYAELIKPWAKVVAQKMLLDVQRRDETMWRSMGDEIGRNLKKEIEFARTGQIMAEALNNQVQLITSLPLQAAQRVHDLTMLGLSDSTRSKEIAAEIMRSGKVTQARANLIARTEVARTATELTAARASAAGVTHYVWRSSDDSDVRESHKKMNGKTIAFAQAPEVEPGKFYHAGEIFNCRCYSEPIISEEL